MFKSNAFFGGVCENQQITYKGLAIGNITTCGILNNN